MNTDFICISQNKITEASGHFMAGKQWLSYRAETTVCEDEQGVLLLFGYVHNQDFNATPAYWLNLLQHDNEQLLAAANMLDGAYNMLLLNKSTGHYSLITDRLGCHRLYYYQSADAIWFSSDLAYIATKAGPSHFDRYGLMETLHFRWLTGQHSLIENVKKLPHAAVVQLQAGKPPALEQRFGLLPARKTQADKTPEAHADAVQQLLCTNIASSVKQTDRVAVLLSGGVDSSVLLAICCQLKLNVIAVTPVHDNHSNPELETAKQFARELGVEHRIVPVKDDMLEPLFCDTVQRLAGAPRSHSAISLLYIMRQLAGEFDKVLYGEGADTLFGSRAVKHFTRRYQKHLKLKRLMRVLPGSELIVRLLPSGSRFKKLADFDVQQDTISSIKLTLQPATEMALADDVRLDSSAILRQLNTDSAVFTNFDSAVRYVKQVVFSSDVVNHFFEMSRLAALYDLQLVNPFVCWPVMYYASQLPDEYYLGGDFVKPILRKIGEQFYTPKLMYLPKFGFPVPHKHWLDTSLNKLSRQAVTFFNVPEVWAEDTEMIWTLTGLYLLAVRADMAPCRLTNGVN